jgi:hypothetical protein
MFQYSSVAAIFFIGPGFVNPTHPVLIPIQSVPNKSNPVAILVLEKNKYEKARIPQSKSKRQGHCFKNSG